MIDKDKIVVYNVLNKQKREVMKDARYQFNSINK